MALTDIIVSGLIKRGIFYENQHLEAEFEIPHTRTESDGIVSEKIKIYVKADNISIKVDKEKNGV